MTPLVAYVLLFVAVGAGFILVHLLAGKLIRPNRPGAEKKTIYECGEPTIGSAWIQFDLRFYVVALLFVIFDVEVAFFFPWAEVFGRANAIRLTQGTPGEKGEEPPEGEALAAYEANLKALIPSGSGTRLRTGKSAFAQNREDAARLAWLAFFDILVFFGVLLVGFAYLWRRGDLAWVRSVAAEREEATAARSPPPTAPTALAETGTGS
jgi:NADH-quinone oxidoreductase subunit A